MLNIGIAVAAIWQLAAGARHVEGLPVLVVSCIAAVIMPTGALILGGGADDDDSEDDLAVKVVLLDTAVDAAVGVAASGAFILGVGGWYWLDPATALGIAVIVGCHALELIRRMAAALRSH